MTRITWPLVLAASVVCCAHPAHLPEEEDPDEVAASERPGEDERDDGEEAISETRIATSRRCSEGEICVPAAASPRQACLDSLAQIENSEGWISPFDCSPRSDEISVGRGAQRQRAAIMEVAVDDDQVPLVVVWGGEDGYDRVAYLFDVLTGAALDEELTIIDVRFVDIAPGGALELVVETRSVIVLDSCTEPLEQRILRDDVSFCALGEGGLFCRGRLPRSFEKTERHLDPPSTPTQLHRFSLEIRLDAGRIEMSLASGALPPSYARLLGTFELQDVPNMIAGGVVMGE